MKHNSAHQVYMLFRQSVLAGVVMCLLMMPFAAQANSIRNPSKIKTATLEIKRGDTLSSVLQGIGVDSQEAYQVITELKNVYNPKSLKVGQEIFVDYDYNEKTEKAHVVNMRIRIDNVTEVVLNRLSDEVILATSVDIPLTKKLLMIDGEIEGSLYGSAQKAGASASVIAEMIRLLSYDVDFQRDIRKGDKFKIAYDQLYNDKDEKAGIGTIYYFSLEVKKELFGYYQFTTRDGKTGFYNLEGESVRKSLLKTPVDGARISSGYGRRKHPVLGYSKMHKGVDFAAPRGTPIYAAGDGVIIRANRFGSYGNYVKIHHSNGYDTAYAHLQRFARGIRKGRKVKQGQVIGYIGTTGRSTGPHLHYEVLKNDRHINPFSMKSVAGKSLKGVERGIFMSYRKQVDKLWD
jgi:murein DD-endopeptidase MepM/ murein hydrolase activator NlpD